MPRLSREESQHMTRRKLIGAAEAEILRCGIYEASIRRICESAGFTLGAFYSNFSDKNELLMEVVEVQMERELDSLKALLATTASLKREAVLSKIAHWLKVLKQNEIYTSLLLEFETYGRHNPAFKERYDSHKMRLHTSVAEALELLFKGQKLRPQIPPMQIAIGLSSLWTGLAIEGRASGTATADELTMVFLEALLQSAAPVQKS